MMKKWENLEFILPRKNDNFTFKEILGEINQYCFEEWQHLIKKEDIIIDLGAHIGLFSLALSTKVKQVFAFEPNQENYNYLIENISHNQIQNITPIKKAVSDENGFSILNVSLLSPARHSLYTHKYYNHNGIAKFEETVETISLSTIFSSYNISFCKLLKADIEGAEYEVFLNSEKQIIQKVGIFLIEYHDTAQLEGKTKLIHFFDHLGFQVHCGQDVNYEGLVCGNLRAYNQALYR